MKDLWEKGGLLASGVLVGTAGLKLLTSKDAKKVYTHATAAVLRAKECVMTSITKMRENTGDIMADAKEINETRAKQESCVIADKATE